MTASTQRVPLAVLVDGPTVRRARGLNADHVEALRTTPAKDLPPILVRHNDGRWERLGGAHRAAAAVLRGDTTIAAVIVECDDTEALRLAIADNVGHGLPLTMAERKDNARRLMAANPKLSDRKVAAACGLSHPTVATLRAGGRNDHLPADQATGEVTGQDGKTYPSKTKAVEQRAAATEFVADHPDATARDIAAATGVSEGTAKTVRREASEAWQWADALNRYPFLDGIPEQYRREAIAGAQGLDQFDATERPRREDNFRRWAESRHEAAAAAEVAKLTDAARNAYWKAIETAGALAIALAQIPDRAADLPAGDELHHLLPDALGHLQEAIARVPAAPRLRRVQ